jgi:hypothetical protein
MLGWAVASKERPVELAACLASIRGESEAPILVVDDSDTPLPCTGRADNVRVLSRSQRSQWCARLAAASGVPETVVRFSLAPWEVLSEQELTEAGSVTTGAARNAALLGSSASTLVMMDDDCRLPLQPVKGALWEAQKARVVRHELVCATSPEVLASECLQGCLSVADALRHVPRQLEGSGLLREIRAVCFGSYGSSGTQSLAWQQRARRLDGGEGDSQQVARFVVRLQLAPFGEFMTTLSAFFLDTMVPPFVPVGRNQDGAFAATLLALSREQGIAWVPACVHHARPGGDAAPQPGPRLCDLISQQMLESAQRDGDYPALSARLREKAQGLAHPRSQIVERWAELLSGWPAMWAARSCLWE